MKKIAKALVVVGAIGIVPVVMADQGPPWFNQFVAAVNAQVQGILSRLQGVEQQTAQNTTDIGQLSKQTQDNTTAIQQNATAIGLNTADIARNSLDISRNSADIQKNTSDIQALQSGAQVYRLADYSSPGDTTNVYSSIGAGACGNSETQTRTKVPQPDGSLQFTLDTVRRLNGVVCQHSVARFILDARGQLVTEQDAVSTVDPTVLLSTTVIEVPIILRPAEMRIGTTWGSASKTIQTSGSAQSVGFATSVGSLTAVDSVTVPAGTFTDCLRAVELRNSSQIGLFTQYDWFCRGVGLVKRISEQGTALVGFQIELQSSTPN